MSLETEDTLKKLRLRDKNYHFQSCHSNHFDIETLPSRKKSFLEVQRKEARVPEAERLAPRQNSALLGTHPGTTTRSVIPGNDDDDDDGWLNRPRRISS